MQYLLVVERFKEVNDAKGEEGDGAAESDCCGLVMIQELYDMDVLTVAHTDPASDRAAAYDCSSSA
jgi:hypothetical protein